ncbi:MAG: phosphohistidine phosphatase SixA [candidate division Zixibacteria bacterium]|nr:phosphohistidine phosphatase SixA [candidate division Zixibacteria bacterium]
MKLYLVRHGQANPANIDPEKGLSDIGKQDIARLAESVRHLSISVEQIWHSGKARAKQTAESLSSVVKSNDGLTVREGLKPNDAVDATALEIGAYGCDLMLVGHLPFMAKLASLLFTGDQDRCAFQFHPGTLACFDLSDDIWSLEYFIHPGIVAPDGKAAFQSYH